MAITYTKDVLQALKDKGFSSYKLRKDRLLGEATIQKLRNNELVSWDNINTICKLLECNIGDILQYTDN